MASNLNNRLADLASSGDVTGLQQELQSRRWLKKDINGALHQAARQGSAECFRCLLKHGASPSCKDSLDRNSLHLVLRYGGGNRDIVTMAIASNLHKGTCMFIDNKDRKGFTALHYASEKGYVECIKELIKARANLDKATSYDRDTPLMTASSKGHIEAVKTLISAGCDVNKRSFFWYTALAMAAQRGKGDCVRAILEAGSDVNASDFSGYTPLMRAAEGGHVNCLEILVEYKANLNQLDSTGRTALFLAVGFQHTEAINYLLASGASINTTNCIGMSAFLMAIKRDDLTLMKKLAFLGADVKQKYMGDGTSVHMACISNSEQCLAHLLETPEMSQHCSVEDVDEKGKTPLTLCCERVFAPNVLILLRHRAKADARDCHGRTPLSCLLRSFTIFPSSAIKVAKLLIRYGCDVNTRGRFDNSVICRDRSHQYVPNNLDLPLEVAIRVGALAIAQMLWEAGSIQGETMQWCSGNVPWFTKPEYELTIKDSTKSRIFSFLKNCVHQPRGLASLCRLTLRQRLQSDIESKVQHLGLPETIQEYINIPEADVYEEEYGGECAESDEDADEEEILSDTISDTTEDESDIPEMDDSGDAEGEEEEDMDENDSEEEDEEDGANAHRCTQS